MGLQYINNKALFTNQSHSIPYYVLLLDYPYTKNSGIYFYSHVYPSYPHKDGCTIDVMEIKFGISFKISPVLFFSWASGASRDRCEPHMYQWAPSAP